MLLSASCCLMQTALNLFFPPQIGTHSLLQFWLLLSSVNIMAYYITVAERHFPAFFTLNRMQAEGSPACLKSLLLPLMVCCCHRSSKPQWLSHLLLIWWWWGFFLLFTGADDGQDPMPMAELVPGPRRHKSQLCPTVVFASPRWSKECAGAAGLVACRDGYCGVMGFTLGHLF